MNPFLKITGITFTIWIMVAVINGLLCGVYISVSGNNAELAMAIFISGLATLIFSIPACCVFWITMLVMISRKIVGRSLFRAGLSTGMILAGITAFCLQGLFNKNERIAMPPLIMLSFLTSIMMHFNQFKQTGNSESQQLLLKK